MKKIACLLLTLLMVVALCTPAIRTPATAADENISADSEAKIYSSATLEDDFADDRVMVVLRNDASLDFKQYSPDDFTSIGCKNVQDLSQGSGKKIKQQYDTMMTAALSRTAVPDTVDAERIGSYNQILCIELQEMGKENVLSAIKELEKLDYILYAGPDYIMTLDSTTNVAYNDTYAADQWALEKIQLPEAWEITTGSSSVVVGVIDSGIDATHPDLVGKVDVENSVDFTSGVGVVGTTVDTNGHGTHVAGIISATGNNGVGVAGVCWNVTLVSLRVASESKKVYFQYVASAIEYAEVLNIPIINLSLGKYISASDNTVLIEALENYTGLAVCSAGNLDWDNDIYSENSISHYPSSYDFNHILAVGASTETDERMEGTGYGKETVDLFAPGEGILSCYPTAMCVDGTHNTTETIHKANGYHYIGGTSMATPYVTGVAAMMLSLNEYLTPKEIKSIIMLNCDKVEALTEYCVTGGRLNAYKAVSNANRYAVMSSNISREIELCRGEYMWFRFTAPAAGSYEFYTVYTDSELDTIGELFSELVADDSTSGRLAYEDDIYTADDGAESDYNFRIVYTLSAGQTVYLRVSTYDEEGTCAVIIR